jgi:hypothetical protein
MYTRLSFLNSPSPFTSRFFVFWFWSCSFIGSFHFCHVIQLPFINLMFLTLDQWFKVSNIQDFTKIKKVKIINGNTTKKSMITISVSQELLLLLIQRSPLFLQLLGKHLLLRLKLIYF